MKTVRCTMLLLTLPVALGGCGLIRGHRNVAALQPETYSAFSAQLALADGRHALDEGRPGLAIEAFRKALDDHAALAPALNGMGVAYARLGSFTTAQRLFAEALAIAPDHGEYLANLDQARSGAADSAARLAASEEPSRPVERATASSDGNMTRVSGHEVMVRTMSPTAQATTAISWSTADRRMGTTAQASSAASARARVMTVSRSSDAAGKPRLIANPYLSGQVQPASGKPGLPQS
ncbi:MAG: hypothetical protein KGJ57_22470 [Sphingomonadales bacterium]|nr:hypothetical protein [Sphingomonadales bacterium]MDE2172150.1 hypothetical protein [Sphingomonadales bacterium]